MLTKHSKARWHASVCRLGRRAFSVPLHHEEVFAESSMESNPDEASRVCSSPAELSSDEEGLPFYRRSLSALDVSSHPHNSSADPWHSHDIIDRVRNVLLHRKWGPDVIDNLRKLQVKLNPHQVTAVLKDMQDADSSLGFFHWAKEQEGYRHNVFTYSRLLNILAEAQEFDTMEIMMQDMLNGQLEMTPYIFTSAAQAYAHAKMPDAAVSVFLSMEKYGCKPDGQAYNIMIDILMRAELHNQAHEMYHRMAHSGYFPSLYICNNLLEDFWREGKSADATAFFQKMKESGEQPTISTYNALVKVFAKDCDAHSLSEVIKEMEEKRSVPNLTTYNTIIGALVQAGNVHIGLKFFDHMVGSGKFPNNFTYSNLIDGLGRMGKLDEAQELFKQLKGTGGSPDEYVYNTLVINLSKGGRWKSALSFLREMKAAGLTPSRATYALVLDSMKQRSKPDDFRCMLDGMRRDGFTPHIVVYHDLLEMYFAKRELDNAFQLFQEVKHLYPSDLGTHNLMLKLCCIAKDMKKSMLIYNDMRRAGLEPSVVTYSTLMQSMGKAGHVKEALEMFKGMRKKGCDPDVIAYGTVLKAMVNAGQVEKAIPIFEEGRKKNPKDLIMYGIMIDGFGKIRKFDKAIALVKEMMRKGIQPDVVIFNSLIASLFKAGEREDAYDLYREMEQYGCRPTAKTKDIVNSFMMRSMRKGRK